MDPIDLQPVDEAIARLGRGRDALIPLLQAVQAAYRYLPEAALKHLAEATDIPAAEIEGVASFYSQFRRRPMGRHLIAVCHGTACHVKGSERVHEAIERHLGIPPGDDTDPERLFTVERVACLGCCTLAPVLQIDGMTFGHMTPERVPETIEEFLDLARSGRLESEGERPAPPDGRAGEIRIGLGSCCMARGSGRVQKALLEAVEQTGARAHVKRVGCVGMCHQTPLVEVLPADGPRGLYARVRPEDARDIVLKHFPPADPLLRLRHRIERGLDALLAGPEPPATERRAIDEHDPPVAAFLRPQKHIATERCGRLDPLDLEEYIEGGGFEALRRALEDLGPDGVIRALREAGLRGRGGAGFPTAEKWARVRQAPGGPKYVVMNGDEGDPGAFMDRMMLESYPFRILEGILIAAVTVGAEEGVLYIRAEYPLAVRRMSEAIARLQEAGYLGEAVLGAGRRLRLRIMQGAGAFVCGEETALLASIMGGRGMPRFRPPYPAEKGLWGRPTLVNNVETFALVPWILRNGPEAFARLGTERSKGTKVFAMAGKVARVGLIEVPMGISIRRVVEEIGGGVAGGRTFKAVQIGGPSGGCVPERLAEVPVDYEALLEVGAMMGSGGLVVLDETDCMVDIARYFLAFTQNQSCGRCTPCRVGTRRMLDILERLCEGRGRPGDLDELETLGHYVKRASLCGLGKTAPNPVLSTLRYFREEYEAHLAGRCPAGRCKALVTYTITDQCIGCTLCAQHCPVEAIEMRPYEQHEIDTDRCTRCDTCRQVCPVDAVEVH